MKNDGYQNHQEILYLFVGRQCIGLHICILFRVSPTCTLFLVKQYPILHADILLLKLQYHKFHNSPKMGAKSDNIFPPTPRNVVRPTGGSPATVHRVTSHFKFIMRSRIITQPVIFVISRLHRGLQNYFNNACSRAPAHKVSLPFG